MASLSVEEEILERSKAALVAGRYRLVRKLGAGGMGSVWLAHDTSLDSQIALKLIDHDKAKSEEVRVRFAREAKAAAQLRGAHVVDVFDHGDSDGTLYIAMEYLRGEDLGARLDRVGRLDAETTYRIVAHVARALVRAHASGIVHRDLKPENVFLVQGDEGETAKVLDFGIAKLGADSPQETMTRTGSFLGTPFYVSPEQARGKSIDYRSDLWSLGVIAFECLTGRLPFESEALGELMGLILYEDLPSPTDYNPRLPAAVDPWWERAAMRDRELRFQSAKEMADTLGHSLGVPRVVSVPSIAPRRASRLDAMSGFVPTVSGRPLLAPGLSSSRRAPNGLMPSLPDPVPNEDCPETDGFVSRKRHAPVPGTAFAWLVARIPGKWRPRLGRRGRRRVSASQSSKVLLAVAITTGVVLGAALTLALSGFRLPDPGAARNPVLVRAQAAAPHGPEQPLAPKAVEVMHPAQLGRSGVRSERPLPVHSAAPPRSEAPESKGRPRPSTPKRRAVRSPDYGI